MLTPIIDGICRAEGPRLLAGLIRRVGDFELAEDAMQDAFTKALEVWPAQGLPASPAAWLTTVARRRALDLLRRRATGPLYTGEPPDLAAPEPEASDVDTAALSGVEDVRLRLVFTCCHPAITQPAQVALALRTLGGLSTREIARAFIEPEATTAQRLVRAKRKILDARIPYAVPSRQLLPERLQAVLGVVYLIFNEGYATTEHDGLVRPDLCAEAIRLARLLVALMPDEPEAQGLLALMLLHDARRATRIGADGALVPLEQQDRGRWQKGEIEEGVALLEALLLQRRRGPYQLQAAIAALHAWARRADETDWPQIALLYGGLLNEQPGPVVELNAAVALAMSQGPEHGLDRIAAFQKIVSGKYKLRIVWDLKDGALRYSEIRSGLLRGAEGSGEIAPRVLSRELKALAENGLIDRKDFGVVPPTVEYRLTAKGRSFVPVIAAIRDWGSAHLGEHVREAKAA